MNGYQILVTGEVGPRDGWSIELILDSGEEIAEVFEDGETLERTVRFHTEKSIPLVAVQWLLEEAERRLSEGGE